MRDAGGEESDRAQLVGLHQLALEFVAIGDVVENDEPANLFAFSRDERRNGHVDHRFALRRSRTGECQPVQPVRRLRRMLLFAGLHTAPERRLVNIEHARRASRFVKPAA